MQKCCARHNPEGVLMLHAMLRREVKFVRNKKAIIIQNLWHTNFHFRKINILLSPLLFCGLRSFIKAVRRREKNAELRNRIKALL